MSLSVYGRSDDLIELFGDIEEEFSAYDEINYLALSNGVLLRIEYAADGVWRISCLSGDASVRQCTVEDQKAGAYSDLAIVSGHVAWALVGGELRL